MVRFMAWPHAIIGKNDKCRYVQLIRLHILSKHQQLRWPRADEWSRGPLLSRKLVEVLHLFRCSTHTPRQAGLFSGRKRKAEQKVRNGYGSLGASRSRSGAQFAKEDRQVGESIWCYAMRRRRSCSGEVRKIARRGCP